MIKYKLSDIVEVISEREDNPSNSIYDKFVGLEHYIPGEVEIKNYGSTDLLVSAMKVFRSGDILIARRNVYLKRAAVVHFDGITSGDSIVLRAKNKLIQKLLPFVLNTDAFWEYAEKFSDGTMSKRLSPKILMEYEFDLPDINRQEKLSEILWATNDAKEAYKKLLRITDDLIESQFVEMFGDPIENPFCIMTCRLGDLYNVRSSKRVYQSEQTSEGVAFLKVADLISYVDTGKFDPIVFIPDGMFDNFITQGLVPKQNDILITTRGTIGKCYIVCSTDRFYFQDGMISWLEAKSDKILPKFLKHMIESELFKPALDEITNKTTVTYVSLDKLSNIRVICPEESAQRQFVKFIEQADESKFELQQTISSLENTMKSLVQQHIG